MSGPEAAPPSAPRPGAGSDAVVAEVRAAFERYEAALRAGDLPVLAASFDDAEEVVRFGIADEQRGAAALAAWRAAQAPPPPGRTLEGTVVVACGQDAAVVSTRFTYPGRPRVGRQQQTWARREGRWRIVAAHVSEIDRPPPPAAPGEAPGAPG